MINPNSNRYEKKWMIFPSFPMEFDALHYKSGEFSKWSSKTTKTRLTIEPKEFARRTLIAEVEFGQVLYSIDYYGIEATVLSGPRDHMTLEIYSPFNGLFLMEGMEDSLWSGNSGHITHESFNPYSSGKFLKPLAGEPFPSNYYQMIGHFLVQLESISAELEERDSYFTKEKFLEAKKVLLNAPTKFLEDSEMFWN